MSKNAIFSLLVIVLAYNFIGCDFLNDNENNQNNGSSGNNGGSGIIARPQSDYYGSWKSNREIIYIIEADKIIEKTSNTQFQTYEHLTWETYYNSNDKTKDVFTIGYKVTGVRTGNNGWPNQTVGVIYSHYFYHHRILNAITVGYHISPYIGNNFTLYYKQ